MLKYRGDPTAWKATIAFLKEHMELDSFEVLDIGFGSGGFSLAIAQYADKVVNFDLRFKEVNLFHDLIEQQNIKNILVSKIPSNYHKMIFCIRRNVHFFQNFKICLFEIFKHF